MPAVNPSMLEELFSNPDWWKLASIPVTAALVGWLTNWLAIQMTFYPVEPIGKPPWLGWQGIIPSKAGKMGAIATDQVLAKLGTLQDIYQAMTPERISAHLVQTLEPRIDRYTDEIMREDNPRLWEMLPGAAKNVVYAMLRQKLPGAVARITQDVGEHLDEMLDLKHTVVQQVERDKNLANRIFLECGAAEFKFLIRSGLYFGFLFGLIQLAVWVALPAWWTLPLFGLLVGYATNWLALRLIFQPLHPRRIGPFTFQGLFLKRQHAVADIWCGIVTEEVLTLRNIANAMLDGPRSAHTHALLRRHIRQTIDEVVGIVKPMLLLTVGVDEYVALKEAGSDKAIEAGRLALDDPAFNADRAQIVKAMMVERMRALSSAEFQNLLRPAFQEDEIKLIALGGILGLLAGLAQLVFVFGGV